MLAVVWILATRCHKFVDSSVELGVKTSNHNDIMSGGILMEVLPENKWATPASMMCWKNCGVVIVVAILVSAINASPSSCAIFGVLLSVAQLQCGGVFMLARLVL